MEARALPGGDRRFDPKMKERIAGFGGTPLAVTPEQFGKLVASETVKWEKVVKTVGLAIE